LDFDKIWILTTLILLHHYVNSIASKYKSVEINWVDSAFFVGPKNIYWPNKSVNIFKHVSLFFSYNKDGDDHRVAGVPIFWPRLYTLGVFVIFFSFIQKKYSFFV
jgi:hypothetical protein